MTDYDALAGELSESNGSNNESTDTSSAEDIPDGVREAPILNVAPNVSVGFDEVIDDMGLMGSDSIKSEQNILKANEQPDDLVVALRNPTVEQGTLWRSDDGGLYKLVDMDNGEIKEDVERDGDDFEVTGVQVYGSEMDGEEVADFDDEFVRLMIGSNKGWHLGMLLDCRGGESAYYEGDEKTSGLVEYPPRYNAEDYTPSDDGYPRFARTGTLRDDMRGESGELFFYLDPDHDDSNDRYATHYVSVFKGEADPDNALERPTAEDGLGEPDYNPFIYWDEPDGDDGSDDSSTTGEVNMDALDGADDDIEAVDDLPDPHQQFVERASESIDPSETDVATVYEQFCEDNDLNTVGVEIVVDEIETLAE